VDASEPDEVKARQVAEFPVSQATTKLPQMRSASPRPKVVKQEFYEDLFRKGVRRLADQKPELEGFNPSTTIGEADFQEDEDVGTYLEVDGKLYPLRSSSLCARRPK
jgi:hypothetical protein